MPQGVEHALIAKQCRESTVKGPMMPQGVEHAMMRMIRCRSFDVKGPMMPQGVEHSIVGRWRRCEW